jgi:UDP-N-acetyl-D-mannosaminuronic acid transferase (WecB/TagA/CpsF family)
MNNNIIYFKKIKFYNYPSSFLIKKISTKGGYLVAPAASSLTTIMKNNCYYKSLKLSTIAILDSGFFCILLRILRREKVSKLSGYLFLKNFLDTVYVKKERILLVSPSKFEAKKNKKFIKSKNFKKINSYVAPNYPFNSNIVDTKLLNFINRIKPKYVLINIGGEKQEILAEYLYRKSKNRKISILCLGAAIAFLTKSQAPISEKIDKYYLGWFFRLIYSPRLFFPRMAKSFYLIKLFR